ncbi:hypothetical protein [Actinoplanes sp. HUAS TT8]|uniref:hypothetical protein n=1 Tax=Actinoplanes sp. HUAS TT8 TaxID=3447453 RepID=UPI003F52335A
MAFIVVTFSAITGMTIPADADSNGNSGDAAGWFDHRRPDRITATAPTADACVATTRIVP